ncbi:MAG: carbon-nitrogen hydrolase family protein [Hyphomicrobiales bacterium]
MKSLIAALLALPLVFGAPVWALPGKIAVVQYHPAFGQTDKNIARLTTYAEEAVKSGANLVLFPEGAIFGYDSGSEVWCRPGMSSFQNNDGSYRGCRDVSDVAETVPFDPTTQYWRKFAIDKGIYVLFNIIEVSDDEYYNTLVAIDPQGNTTPYRKRILFETEYPYASPGDDSVMLDTPFGKFGLMICIDGFDTNAQDSLDRGFYSDYKAAGANAILIPMNWDTYDAENEFAAQSVFADRAKRFGIDIFASDAYDGTARYWASGAPRDRGGLPAPVNSEGVSYHTVNY